MLPGAGRDLQPRVSHVVLLLLPAAAFLLLFLLFQASEPGAGRASAVLRAATAWGVALAALTEGLSLAGALGRGPIVAAWGLTVAGLGAVWWRRGRPVIRAERPRLGRGAPWLLLPVALILLGTLLSAALGWPNQWDSMVYHLSRVDHWLQNRSVAFYPTHVIRQLFNPPGAEYVILHLRALGGDDRWSNAPQWLAMAGSLAGAAAIAGRLGAGSRGRLFAVVVAATIPMGILQASGTQNDYVAAFWLVCMADAVLSPPSRARTLQLGAAMGLALLAKGTALLFAPALLLALPELTGGPWARRLRLGGSAALLALALNGGHWARNTAVFGWPLGPRGSGSADGVRDKLTNDAAGPRVVASNLIRNLTLHLGTPIPRLNRALETATLRTHAALGIAVDDPRTTRLYSDTRFAVRGEPADPDRTGNPVHLLLALSAAAIVAATASRRSPLLLRYTIALAAAALLFCLVLKWQPWHSRLQLPLFVLSAPLVAAAWEASARVPGAAAFVLGALALPPLLLNRLAPLAGKHTVFDTPRANQYFQSFGGHPSARQRDYLAALDLLAERGCGRIGLLLGWDDWEHPLWTLRPRLDQGQTGRRRLAHVGVSNATAGLRTPGPELTPCALVVGGAAVGDSVRHGDRWFSPADGGGGLRVYFPSASPADGSPTTGAMR